MERHTKIAIDAMEEALERARMRDSRHNRALRLAITCALTGHAQLENPAVDEAHKAILREVLAECQALGAPVDGIPREEVLADLRREVEEENATRELARTGDATWVDGR